MPQSHFTRLVILSEAKDLNRAENLWVEMLRPECLPGLAFGAQHDNEVVARERAC
jgi:hypothetical protein